VKNWKAIAQANGFEIPEPDLDRIAPALDALELAFRPAVTQLPDDALPAVTFCAEEEAE
jgi:hypothetical protein